MFQPLLKAEIDHREESTVKRTFGLIAFMMAFIASSVAFSQSLDDLRGKRRLVVGSLVDFSPYGFIDREGKPDGFDIDFAKLLGKKLGLPVEIVPVAGANRIPFLLSGKVDILVAALGMTQERAQQVDFSIPYERLNSWLIARKDRNIKSWQDMAGSSFAVTRGSTDDLSLTKNAPSGTTILRFDDDATTRQAVISAQVDGSSLSDTSIKALEKVLPEIYERKFAIRSQLQGVGVRKGADELLGAINKAIEDAKADGSLRDIRLKWIGQDVPDLSVPKLD
ncbi:transporter substrate-binding domain-containing protein [Microvirga sp. M2]|uniref:transporter substrate-binding domain-containing protein n=1 Tax=Microvirga sp. M2 TaxID=3073270 RepID=UPI0039C2E2AC